MDGDLQDDPKYIPELISSVHITQGKILTSVKLRNVCKKLSIEVPTINKFIHNIFFSKISLCYRLKLY